MSPKVEHHFDFGSPNAYCAHKMIPAIQQRTGVTFNYVPVLLGGVFKLTNNMRRWSSSRASRTSWSTSASRPSAS